MKTVTLFVGDENGLRDVNKSINPGQYQEKPLDGLCEEILEGLFNGMRPPSSTGKQDVTNALTRLRRRGLIENRGTRARPNWTLTLKARQR